MNAKYVRYIILVLLLSCFSVYSQTIPFGFFKKMSSLVYSFIGGTLGATGYVTNAQFKNGSIDGAFNYAADVAVDPANDFLYVADSYNHRVQKFILSTGVFVGAIGNSTLSGTCIAGKQNGWCTGGGLVLLLAVANLMPHIQLASMSQIIFYMLVAVIRFKNLYFPQAPT